MQSFMSAVRSAPLMTRHFPARILILSLCRRAQSFRRFDAPIDTISIAIAVGFVA
jgi:hypothetical protein